MRRRTGGRNSEETVTMTHEQLKNLKAAWENIIHEQLSLQQVSRWCWTPQHTHLMSNGLITPILKQHYHTTVTKPNGKFRTDTATKIMIRTKNKRHQLGLSYMDDCHMTYSQLQNRRQNWTDITRHTGAKLLEGHDKLTTVARRAPYFAKRITNLYIVP